MILKLVGHSENDQVKIHTSISIYNENVNLGLGWPPVMFSDSWCFGQGCFFQFFFQITFSNQIFSDYFFKPDFCQIFQIFSDYFFKPDFF